MDIPWNSPEELDALRRAFGSLTPRQQQVVRRLGDGARQADVARELSVTPQTVSFHVRRIIRRLGLHSRRELMKYAVLLARAAGDDESRSSNGPH